MQVMVKKEEVSGSLPQFKLQKNPEHDSVQAMGGLEELSNEDLVLEGNQYITLKEKQNQGKEELTSEEETRLDHLSRRLGSELKAWLEYHHTKRKFAKAKSAARLTRIPPLYALQGLDYDPLGCDLLTPEQEVREAERCLRAAYDIANFNSYYPRVLGLEQSDEEVNQILAALLRTFDPKSEVRIAENITVAHQNPKDIPTTTDDSFTYMEGELAALLETFPDFAPGTDWIKESYEEDGAHSSSPTASSLLSERNIKRDLELEIRVQTSFVHESATPNSKTNSPDADIYRKMAALDITSVFKQEPDNASNFTQGTTSQWPFTVSNSTSNEVRFKEEGESKDIIPPYVGLQEMGLKNVVQSATSPKTTTTQNSSSRKHKIIFDSETEFNSHSNMALGKTKGDLNSEALQEDHAPKRGKRLKSTYERGSISKAVVEFTPEEICIAPQSQVSTPVGADWSSGNGLHQRHSFHKYRPASQPLHAYEDPNNFVVQRTIHNPQSVSRLPAPMKHTAIQNSGASQYSPPPFSSSHSGNHGPPGPSTGLNTLYNGVHNYESRQSMNWKPGYASNPPMNQPWAAPCNDNRSSMGHALHFERNISSTPTDGPGGNIHRYGNGTGGLFSKTPGHQLRNSNSHFGSNTRSITSSPFNDNSIPLCLPGPSLEFAAIAFSNVNLRDDALALVQDLIFRNSALKELVVVQPHPDDLTLKVSGPLGSNVRGQLKMIFPGAPDFTIKASIA